MKFIFEYIKRLKIYYNFYMQKMNPYQNCRFLLEIETNRVIQNLYYKVRKLTQEIKDYNSNLTTFFS